MARRAFLTRMAQLAALPFLTAAGALQAQTNRKQLKILMKSAWGSDDPTKAAFPFFPRARACRGRARGADLSARRGCRADAQSRRRRGHARRLAGGWRLPEQAGWQARADLRLRRVLTRARRHRSRSDQLWSEIRQPAHLRFAGRMGGPRDHGVGDSGPNEGFARWGSQRALRYT